MPPISPRRGRAVFLLLGASALLAQVILLRKLLAVFSGNELTVAVMLSGWMSWTGLAGLLLGRISDRIAKPHSLLAGVLFLAGLALPLTALATAKIKPWLGLQPGEIAGLSALALTSFLLTGPVCALLGFAFNLCCRLVTEKRLAVGRVYLWEALGAGLAGGAFTFLLAGRTTAFAQAQLTSGLLWLGAGLVFPSAAARLALYGLAAGVSLAGFFAPPRFSLEALNRQWRWTGQKVLAEIDSRYANLVVIERGAERTFYVDGLPAWTTPLPEPSEYTAHLPLSMCPRPETVLLIGGGLAGPAAEILKHPVARLDYVQMDPGLTALEKEFVPQTSAIAADSRVRLHYQDGRRFLAHTGERFDAILLNLPVPGSAQLNRFYTVEFFRMASDHLNPTGVLMLSAGAGGNYLTDSQAELLVVLRQTLTQVFPQVVTLPLNTIYLVAGKNHAQVTNDPKQIMAVLRERRVSTRWLREYYLDAELSRERLAALSARIEKLGPVPANRDFYPRGYLLGMALWAELAQDRGRQWLSRAKHLPAPALAGPALALLLLGLPPAVRKSTGRAAAAVFTALTLGFVGLTAEVAVIMAFQILEGYVYQWLSLLVAVFMVGLAAGAWFGERQSPRRPPASPGRLVPGLLLLLLCGPALWLSIKLLSAAKVSGAPFALGLALGLFWLAAVSGALFTRSAEVWLEARGGVGRAAGWVNGADHLGAAGGAFLTGTLVIPVFGLDRAFWLCGLMPAGALVLVLLAAARRNVQR